MPDRGSSPDLHRTVSDLYPTPLSSDPSELADQTQSLFQAHARAAERSLTTHKASAGRLNALEGRMDRVQEKVTDIEGAVVKGMTDLKEAMVAGFAETHLERTRDRTKWRTSLTAIAIGYTILTTLGAAAWHYLSKPSCKPDEALIGDRCVAVEHVVVK